MKRALAALLACLMLVPAAAPADGSHGIACGFVQMVTGLGRGYESVADQWEVEPVPGEITREQAVALAVQMALELEELPADLRSAEALQELERETTWLFSPETGLVTLYAYVDFFAGDYLITAAVNPDGTMRYVSLADENGVTLERAGF